MTASRYSPGTTSESFPARVESFQQVGDVPLQRGLIDGIERREGLERGSIELAEHLNPVRTRAIAKVELPARAADVGGL